MHLGNSEFFRNFDPILHVKEISRATSAMKSFRWIEFENFIQSPNFFIDVSFHDLFHVKFGYLGCCDFSINNPQNLCFIVT